jgi:hypothetical protein
MNRYEEDMAYEFNAQFDSVSEAYAATALDPIYEGYCSYCDSCEQDGTEPVSYEAFRAHMLKPVAAAPFQPDYGCDEIPF